MDLLQELVSIIYLKGLFEGPAKYQSTWRPTDHLVLVIQ
jgi:hypothetical protein